MPEGNRDLHIRTRRNTYRAFFVYEVKGPDNWSRLLHGSESAVPDEVLRRKRSRYRGHAICLYGPKVGVGLVSQCRRNDDTTRTTTATTTATKTWPDGRMKDSRLVKSRLQLEMHPTAYLPHILGTCKSFRMFDVFINDEVNGIQLKDEKEKGYEMNFIYFKSIENLSSSFLFSSIN